MFVFLIKFIRFRWIVFEVENSWHQAKGDDDIEKVQSREFKYRRRLGNAPNSGFTSISLFEIVRG